MKPNPRDHVVAFLETFVYENRRQRWLYLFEKDAEKLRHNSSKLLKDIDGKYLAEDKHLQAIADHNIEGVFYDIGGKEPALAILADILEEQRYFDAIFSIRAGRLAIFLFHEGQKYVLSA